MVYDGTTLRRNLSSSETPWGQIGPWNFYINMYGNVNRERSFGYIFIFK